MLRLATQGLFIHNDILFKQIDGVAMGSPLGPTMANFFFATLEKNVFEKFNKCAPMLYLRYVDDVFAIFVNDDMCYDFLNVLNSQHKNLKFTIENASEFKSFLDVEIKVTENHLDTWVWRKPTNTGLLLNFNAFCPMKWKSGLILCLLHRAKVICSSTFFFNEEVDKLRLMFFKNGYPKCFFDKVFNKFQCSVSTQNPDNNEFVYCVFVPFFGKISQQFVRRLSKILKLKFNVDISPVYKTYKVGNYFQLKSRTPLALCSNVVYKFTSSCDTNLTYIGMSTRHLSTRVKEHLNFKNDSQSAIKDHIMSCNKCCSMKYNLKSFKIIKKCNSEFQTKIFEAMLIKKLNPTLNRQLYANGSSFLLNVF